jgi:hypothetical protein
MLQIFFGVVAIIVLVGFLTNTIEWYFSGIKKIADEYPQQPVRDGPGVHSGEHMFAVTKERHTVPEGRRFSAMGCLGVVGSVAVLGIGVGFLVTYFRGGSGAALSTLWLGFFAVGALGWFVWVLAMFRWVVTAKAWHRLVNWQADDEHLHIRPQTSVGAPNATVSIPWAELDPIDVDPNAPMFIRAPVGRNWLHADRAMFQRELEVRGQLDLAPQEPAGGEAWHEVVRDDRAGEPAPPERHPPRDDARHEPRGGRPAQSWDDLESRHGRQGGNR